MYFIGFLNNYTLSNNFSAVQGFNCIYTELFYFTYRHANKTFMKTLIFNCINKMNLHVVVNK